MDQKEIGYMNVGWTLVVLYVAQWFGAYKYGNEILNFTAFENISRPGGRLVDFQEQEESLPDERVAALVIIWNEVTELFVKNLQGFYTHLPQYLMNEKLSATHSLQALTFSYSETVTWPWVCCFRRN
jgi:hypothetical protein